MAAKPAARRRAPRPQLAPIRPEGHDPAANGKPTRRGDIRSTIASTQNRAALRSPGFEHDPGRSATLRDRARARSNSPRGQLSIAGMNGLLTIIILIPL